jgi:hypothetical protein
MDSGKRFEILSELFHSRGDVTSKFSLETWEQLPYGLKKTLAASCPVTEQGEN